MMNQERLTAEEAAGIIGFGRNAVYRLSLIHI